MTGAKQLRALLVRQRRTLIDRLATEATGDEAEMIEPGFLRLLADLQNTIAAVDAVLAEADTMNGDI